MPLTLTSEIAEHYLEIIKLLGGEWLLQGPLTSHPWFRLSATSYYLFFPIFALFRFHPLTLSYVWIIISILLIPLNFFVIKKIFDDKTAWISSILLISSPLFMNLFRLPSFFNFIIPLFYFLLLAVKSKKIWLIFLIISLMCTLHAAAFMLVPLFVGLFLIIKRFNKKQSVLSIISFLIPQIPFLLNDYYHSFTMIRNLFLWVPYKMVNFLTGKTLGLNRNIVKDETLKNIFDYLKLNFFPENFPWLIGIIVLIVIVIYFQRKKTTFIEKILFHWLIFGFLILLIHKNPPLHYFVPIYFIPMILISRIISMLKNNFLIAILFILITLNSIAIFQKSKSPSDYISYKDQEKIAKVIIKDSKGQKFQLSRQGPFDSYIGQFSQNYEYILWWLGNRPVTNLNLKYLIIEDNNKQNIKGKMIGRVNEVIIFLISK